MGDNPRTIVTGCRLVEQSVGATVWGDLWVLHNDILIFNGAYKREGRKTDWKYGDREREEKEIFLLPGADFFERRGVIVMELDDPAILINTRMAQHLQRWEEPIFARFKGRIIV